MYRSCEFPRLGAGPVLMQRAPQPDGNVLMNVFNTGDEVADQLVDWPSVGLGEKVAAKALDAGHHCMTTERGVQVSVRPHASCRLLFSPRA